jgi:hypothetical protein
VKGDFSTIFISNQEVSACTPIPHPFPSEGNGVSGQMGAGQGLCVTFELFKCPCLVACFGKSHRFPRSSGNKEAACALPLLEVSTWIWGSFILPFLDNSGLI